MIPILMTDGVMEQVFDQGVPAQEKVNIFLEAMKGLAPGIINFGVRLLIAALMLLIGMRIIRGIRKMVRISLERADVEITLRRFLDAFVNAILTGVLIFIAAGQIGMDTASLIAILGSAGLALGLALQGCLTNFAGGVLILLVKPFRADDYIVTANGEGTVVSIGLVYTTLLTVDNKKIVIPNGTLANSPMTNVTTMEMRRLDLTVGIGYRADIKKAKEILSRAYEEHPDIVVEEGISVYVDNLGESAVTLGARGWVRTESYWQTKWDLTEEIKLAFDREGIEIPYNYLNVQVSDARLPET